MKALIGFDVGYSQRRKTCGVAVRGLTLPESGRRQTGPVQYGAYRIDEARALMRELM